MIDLHCHSTLSDGSLGIEEIIRQAAKVGVDTLCITDHDTLSGYSRAKFLGERYQVKTIQGVEMSAWDKERGQKVHVLCYAPRNPDRLEMLCLKSKKCTIAVNAAGISKIFSDMCSIPSLKIGTAMLSGRSSAERSTVRWAVIIRVTVICIIR